MKNCKDKVIFKFDVILNNRGNSLATNREKHKRAEEKVLFFIDFIEKFSPYNYREIVDMVYKLTDEAKDIPTGYEHLRDPLELGREIVGDQHNISYQMAWDMLYVGINKGNIDVLEYFEKNTPSWVTKVKKI